MSKHTRWLATEIERWTADKIITAEQAGRIRALYAEPAGTLSWGLLVFFGLGAVVIGLGVILLFAYNWDEIPRLGKVGLIVAATAAAHLGGLRQRAAGGWRGPLGEALSLLGTMGFGAGIWLVAQAYHIDEHFPNGFLIWAIGATAMAWTLDSVPQAIVGAILFAIWGGAEAWRYDAPVDASSLLIAAAIGPLVWRLRSALLFAVVLASLYWLILVNAGHYGGQGAVFANAIGLSVLLLGARRVLGVSEWSQRSAATMTFFGWVGFMVCAFVLTFKGAGHVALEFNVHAGAVYAAVIYRWLLVLPAAAIWGWLLVQWLRGARGLVPFEEWLCPIGLVYAQALSLMPHVDGFLISTAFNLICLAIAAAWMVRGCREGRLKSLVVGSLVLACVLFARYFDLFDSLALRGLAFLVFGAALFFEGFYYRKLRRSDVAEIAS